MYKDENEDAGGAGYMLFWCDVDDIIFNPLKLVVAHHLEFKHY